MSFRVCTETNDMQLVTTMSTGITSIGLWHPQSRPQKCGRIHKPKGVWTDSGRAAL